MADTLNARLAHIRKLRSQGSTYEVEAMFEVVDLEHKSVLWRRDGARKFEDVLRDEAGVCTRARFRAFKKAVEHFPRKTIDQLGVPCVCLLANQNAGTRDRMLKHAMEFRKNHGVEPTYQYFSRYLRKPGGPISRKRLKEYIEVLKKMIKELGGRAPTME